MSCLTCFSDYIMNCSSEIEVQAKVPVLGAYGNYSWLITDKFGKKYSQPFTEDVNGFWIITIADLPAGLFTPYSGLFRLEVLDDGCGPVNFNIYRDTLDEIWAFDCIEFSVKGGSQIKNSLGCFF